jgi:L-lactate dehydrogenase complex protein LldG
MSARDAILGKVRAALRADAGDEARRRKVLARLRNAPAGIVPARGQLPPEERVKLFCQMAERMLATVRRLKRHEDVPKAVASYLRARNLPAEIRMGGDPRLEAMPWDGLRAFTVRRGASDGDDEAGVSYAFGGIAETGTVVMLSGADNPSTINFLPEHHIVVVDAAAIEGDLEAAIAGIRRRFGKGRMPRMVNLISGPSRSGDIEQKLVLGAHGPRALHLIVVG